ncbi:MAG: cytochrome P450 [Mycobacterium sp.]
MAATVGVELDKVDLHKIDLGVPELWRAGPPLDVFARLRRECPVHWSDLADEPNEPGFWSVTRAKDIGAVARDWETFSSERAGMLLYDDWGLPLEMVRQQLTGMDPPRHDTMRALFQNAFTPRKIAGYAEHVRTVIKERFDEIDGRERIDLVADLGKTIPPTIIGDLLGAPREAVRKLVEMTERALGTFVHKDGNRGRDNKGMEEAIAQVAVYVAELVPERRKNPKNDMTSVLIHAEVGGCRLDVEDLVIFWAQVMVAGNDSTRAVYSSGMHALLQDREQFEWLQANPSHIKTAVEEMIRCFPAFSHFRRTASRDVELHGQRIKENDKVVLWLVSGCYDEELNDNPMRFDVRRSKVEHPAFNQGVHFCLGNALARMELQFWVEETLRRYPQMTLDGVPQRPVSTWLNQYTSVPVRLGPRAE